MSKNEDEDHGHDGPQKIDGVDIGLMITLRFNGAIYILSLEEATLLRDKLSKLIAVGSE